MSNAGHVHDETRLFKCCFLGEKRQSMAINQRRRPVWLQVTQESHRVKVMHLPLRPNGLLMVPLSAAARRRRCDESPLSQHVQPFQMEHLPAAASSQKLMLLHQEEQFEQRRGIDAAGGRVRPCDRRRPMPASVNLFDSFH